jgi:DNA-binding XRE family transcriptional regulator
MVESLSNLYPMNAKKITQQSKRRGRYVRALLVLHAIDRAELASKIGVSQAFLSMIITGRRIGAKEKGKLARQVIAESLGMTVEDLWPKKAA